MDASKSLGGRAAQVKGFRASCPAFPPWTLGVDFSTFFCLRDLHTLCTAYPSGCLRGAPLLSHDRARRAESDRSARGSVNRRLGVRISPFSGGARFEHVLERAVDPFQSGRGPSTGPPYPCTGVARRATPVQGYGGPVEGARPLRNGSIARSSTCSNPAPSLNGEIRTPNRLFTDPRALRSDSARRALSCDSSGAPRRHPEGYAVQSV